jgi:hypothetical protein
MTWIPFTEQHPPQGVGILVTDGSLVTCAEFHGMNHRLMGPDLSGHKFGGIEWEFEFHERNITHWAPLPEPPDISG